MDHVVHPTRARWTQGDHGLERGVELGPPPPRSSPHVVHSRPLAVHCQMVN